MPRDARGYLWDVQRAANAIMNFVSELDAASYAETDVVHSAVDENSR
jgi:uncharacterized protein with HEPN domain